MAADTPESKETARLETFSDGVFAIAITLLILDIHVPPPGGTAAPNSLLPALLKLWPAYLAYVISFVTILIMWLNHHVLFKIISRVDNRFLLLNGLLLMLVTFVNFPTALLADYIEHPDRQIAAMVYSGTFVITAIVYNGLWWYASRGYRLLDKSTDPALVRIITRQYMFGPVLYLAAFLAAWFSLPLSVAINAFLAVFFAFTGSMRTGART